MTRLKIIAWAVAVVFYAGTASAQQLIKPGNVFGPSSAGAGSIACFGNTGLGLLGKLLKDCSLINDGAITSGLLPPLVSTSNSTSVTAALIRANVTGQVQRDVNQSVVYLAPGTTFAIADANAYSAYVRSDVAGGGGANGVGFKSMSICNQTIGCFVWGGNSILSDSLVNNIVTAVTGQGMVGWEYDFGITSPFSVISGINFQLQGSISQPAAADAVACSPNVAGTIKWTHCLVSNNGGTGAGGAAVYIGAQALSGNNILSQNVQYAYFDGAGAGRIYTTGISAAQQFYIQTSAGAGLANLSLDGSMQMPQTGQFSLGGDTIIGSGGAGLVVFGNGASLTSVAIGNGLVPVVMAGTVFRMPKYLIASLPTCNVGNDGAKAVVIDANSTTYNAIAVTGGANHMPVLCDGTNWRLH